MKNKIKNMLKWYLYGILVTSISFSLKNDWVWVSSFMNYAKLFFISLGAIFITPFIYLSYYLIRTNTKDKGLKCKIKKAIGWYIGAFFFVALFLNISVIVGLILAIPGSYVMYLGYSSAQNKEE